MPITDNRSLVADAESLAPTTPLAGDWVNIADSTMGPALNTDIFVQDLTSISDRYSGAGTEGALLFRADADQDWSNNVFYIWWASFSALQLDTKENGGIAMRFTGATETDYFDVYLDGSDTYGGGFKMAVVDIEVGRALALASSPQRVGGTPPATTAIRRVGIRFLMAAVAVGAADNSFVDAIWRLPIGEPGVIVSGQNESVSPIRPYNWADIIDAGDNADPTKAWGVSRFDSGIVFLNTPIQFGTIAPVNSPLNVHSFFDTNKVIAWETHSVQDGFYGFTILGHGFGGQQFLAGVSDGEVGSQGWVVTAEQPDGPRWFIDASSDLTDEVGFYGCSLIHSSVIDIDSLTVSMLNSLLIDGQRLWHSR